MGIHGADESLDKIPGKHPRKKSRKERAALKRRRRGILRIKMLLFLIALALLIYSSSITYLGPALRGPLERGASSALATAVSIESLHINPFTLSASASGIRVADTKEPAQDVFLAEEIALSVSPLQLLRARLVINELRVRKPRMRVERLEDGSFNMEDFSPDTVEERRKRPEVVDRISERAKEAARKRDWVNEIERLLKKLEELRRRRPNRPPAPPREVKPSRHGRKVEFPALNTEPRIHIKLIEIDGIRIELKDKVTRFDLPALVNGRITMTDFAIRQRLAPEPLMLDMAFGLEDTPESIISATFALDLSEAAPKTFLDIQAASIPLERIKTITRWSLPVEFQAGAATFRSEFALDGLNLAGNVHAACLDIRASVAGSERIIGLSPNNFERFLNSIGYLDLDFNVYGPLYALSSDLQYAVATFFETHGVRIAGDYLQKRVQTEIDRRIGDEKDKFEEKYGIELPAYDIPPVVIPRDHPSKQETEDLPTFDIEKEIEDRAERALKRLLERGIK